MKLSVVFVLLSAVVSAYSQIPPFCLAPAYNQFGSAICGTPFNFQCPSVNNTCQYFPGANFGPCCLGCGGGQTPSATCNSVTNCAMGQRCVKPVQRPTALGVCCSC